MTDLWTKSIWLEPITRKKSLAVLILFPGTDAKPRTLCYFLTDLSNDGFGKSGYREFSERLGATDSLLKSASYLVHINSFKLARNSLLKQYKVMIQDDSGIAVKFFKAGEWKLRSFGHSGRPISIFSNPCQPELKRLFSKGEAENIDFGIGYRWLRNQSNVLIAEQR